MTAALLFLRAYWKPLAIGGVIGLLFLALMITRGTLADRAKERDQARVALQAQIATYEAAADKAKTDAKAKEARDAQITQETQNDLQAQLTAARASAAAYAKRLQSTAGKADTGSGTSVPQAADATGSADGTGSDAIMADDLAICSDNTVKAQGWQEWWKRVSAGQ